MLEYQSRYVENTKQIMRLLSEPDKDLSDFSGWSKRLREREAEMEALRKENTDILSRELFPTLDRLYEADEEEISGMTEFADKLMDWSVNLDIGVYVLIHDALLSLARQKNDRDRMIMELYRLGMGYYYLNRALQGIDKKETARFYFRNEMLFTEAGSYLKFFPEIDNEETKGYIIRSLANIAITASDRRKRVAVTSRILKIIRDPYYRELAPGLPWDRFLRASNQQMSANRIMLSRGELSPSELSEILEACVSVFEPEKNQENPNIRWLWPYYEMQYSCGFASLQTTVGRLEELIDSQPYDQYDMSGLYGNIQLPVYYGALIEKNPALLEDAHVLSFLIRAYDKMLKTVTGFPPEKYDEYFRYQISLIFSNYYETKGVQSYREVTEELMKRLFPREYIEGRRVGELMQTISSAIMRLEPDFFDDIPFIHEIRDPEEKEKEVLRFAGDCGLYHDFGLLKMNFSRTMATRNLFENEYQLFTLHTIAGKEDLKRRASTSSLADIAWGHHADYNGAGGYPSEYVRNQSPYRMMTDVASVAVFLAEKGEESFGERIEKLFREEGRRFSPMVTKYLSDRKLQEKVKEILCSPPLSYEREIFESAGNSL